MHRQDPNYGKTDVGAIVQGCLMLALFPFLVIYGVWAWAVVFKSIWVWYVVPTFQMVPLTFTQCVAVSAVVGLFFIKSTMANHKDEKNEDGSIKWDALWTKVAFGFIAPWITWVVYWFIKAVFI